jgi:hypothetical protein
LSAFSFVSIHGLPPKPILASVSGEEKADRSLSCFRSAFAADALTIAKAHDSGVTKALKDCKPQEIVDMYEDDAIAVYPGEGEIGRGKGESKGWSRSSSLLSAPTTTKTSL